MYFLPPQRWYVRRRGGLLAARREGSGPAILATSWDSLVALLPGGPGLIVTVIANGHIAEDEPQHHTASES